MKYFDAHHSSAILMSEDSDLKDPETKKMAEEIIKVQEEEIAKMKQLINSLEIQ